MNPLIPLLILGVSGVGIGGLWLSKRIKTPITTAENAMNAPQGSFYNASADLIDSGLMSGNNPISVSERAKGVITTPGVAGQLPVARPVLGTGLPTGNKVSSGKKPRESFETTHANVPGIVAPTPK